MTYYGFKIGLRVSSLGMITHCPLLNARSHDVNHTDELLEDVSGMIRDGYIPRSLLRIRLDRARLSQESRFRKSGYQAAPSCKYPGACSGERLFRQPRTDA